LRLHRAGAITRSSWYGEGTRKRLERIGCSAELLPDIIAAVERLRPGDAGPQPGCVVIGEDALTSAAELARLRHGLPPGVPITLLLRPDFDLRTVHSATDQPNLKVLIAPLVPADLYALVRPAEAPAVAAPPAPLAPPVRAQMLVVEDNPMNQIIAREMVAALGHSPVVVGSGEDALAICRNTPPDLVLMDIQMPGMDGLETTRRLRALQATGELRRFPIIALTAHAMTSDRQASMDAGLDEHLTKPLHLDTLRSVLGQWLATPG